MQGTQSMLMKWVLFWVFVMTFVLAVLGTLGIIFFGFGTPTPDERSLPVKALVGEIATAVIVLFCSMFNLKKITKESPEVEVKTDNKNQDVLNSLIDSVAELQTENTLLKELIAFRDSLRIKVHAVFAKDNIFTVDSISKEIFPSGYDQEDRGYVLSIIGELVKEGIIEGVPAHRGQGYHLIRKY